MCLLHVEQEQHKRLNPELTTWHIIRWILYIATPSDWRELSTRQGHRAQVSLFTSICALPSHCVWHCCLNVSVWLYILIIRLYFFIDKLYTYVCVITLEILYLPRIVCCTYYNSSFTGKSWNDVYYGISKDFCIFWLLFLNTLHHHRCTLLEWLPNERKGKEGVSRRVCKSKTDDEPSTLLSVAFLSLVSVCFFFLIIITGYSESLWKEKVAIQYYIRRLRYSSSLIISRSVKRRKSGMEKTPPAPVQQSFEKLKITTQNAG